MSKKSYTYDSGYQEAAYDIRASVVKPKLEAQPATGPNRSRRLAPLEKRAQRVLRILPADHSLAFTVEHYPHLVNQIAFLWDDAKALGVFVDALMIDERGGRAGFPFDALRELTGVRDFRVAQLTGRRDL